MSTAAEVSKVEEVEHQAECKEGAPTATTAEPEARQETADRDMAVDRPAEEAKAQPPAADETSETTEVFVAEAECKEEAPVAPTAAQQETADQEMVGDQPAEEGAETPSKALEEEADIDMAVQEDAGADSQAPVETSIATTTSDATEAKRDEDATDAPTAKLETRQDSRMETADAEMEVDRPAEEAKVTTETTEMVAAEVECKEDAPVVPAAELEVPSGVKSQAAAEERPGASIPGRGEAEDPEDAAQVPDAVLAETDLAENGQEVPTTGIAEEERRAEEAEAQPETQAVQVPGAASTEPQKPKKAGNSYSLYSNSIREEVLKEAEAESGVKPKLFELTKLLASRWSALPEEEKKVWKERATTDKQRYEAEMLTYSELLDPVGTQRAKCEHLIPKKPRNYFGLFLEDATNRGKAHGMLIMEGKEPCKKHLMAKLGGMWRSASDKEKARFHEQAQKEQLEFDEKQRVWEASPECTELGRVTKEHEERLEALEEAARLEREAKEKVIAERNAKKAQPKAKDSTPTKRQSEGPVASPPDVKKPRVVAAKEKAAVKEKAEVKEKGPQLDEDVLMEATKLGWESSFRNLATRAEVLASGKTAGEILECLRASGGLVNPAKRALLGC